MKKNENDREIAEPSLILIFNNQIKIGPGLFFILPCIDNIITVDLRTITFDVAPQVIFFVIDFIYKTIIIFSFFKGNFN